MAEGKSTASLSFERSRVVGPGALGAPFAAFLALFGGVSWTGQRAGVTGPLAFRFRPLDPGAAPVDVSLPVVPSPQGRGVALFVTLPPARAVAGALDALEALYAREGVAALGSIEGRGTPPPASPDGPLVLVFGNNGLLPSDLPARIRAHRAALGHSDSVGSAQSSIALLRALFYTGFLRDGIEIRHTGGTRVLIGPLDDAPASRAACEAFLARVGASPRGDAPVPAETFAPLFAFEPTPDVRRAEWVKFFVNAMLAVGTGPRALPNGTLTERMDDGRLSAWARVFERALARASARALTGTDACADVVAGPVARADVAPRNGADFLTALRATVASTAANVNSVSLAASRGEVETFACFVETLARECVVGDAANAAGDGFVASELARARAEWGL